METNKDGDKTTPETDVNKQGDTDLNKDKTDKDKEIDKDKDKKDPTEIINGLVEEIKDLRKKNQDLQDAKDKEKDGQTPNKDNEDKNDDIEARVKAVLEQERSTQAKANKQAAFEGFIAENDEYSEENDPAGVKRAKLLEKFNMFNTDGKYDKESFLSVVKDAHVIISAGNPQKEPNKEYPYSSVDPKGGKVKTVDTDKELSSKEQKLMKMTGRTKDELIKLRESKPQLYETLLDRVRD